MSTERDETAAGPAEFAPAEEALPGLEAPARSASRLELAARRTIKALRAEGLLTERHAVLCQLMLDLAEVIDAGRRNGKASAAAMAAAQLTAAYELMVPDDEPGGDENSEWSRLVAELRGSGTPPRDPAEPAAGD